MAFQFFVVGNRSAKTDPNDLWNPIYTLDDAFKPRPAVDYVVKNLFPCPSLSIVYGAPSTLKSFQLADLAVCVAAGKLWLEPFEGQQCRTFQTKQACVFWLDFDNGPRRTHERLEALAKAHGLSSTDRSLHYVSMPKPWLDSSNADSMEKLGDQMERSGTKLLIADNLGVISGGVDENSIKMASVMSNWRRLAEDHNMAVVLIHHQTKYQEKSGRAGASLRGHSSIEAALDLALLVERDDQSAVINLKSTKTRGADVPPFAARFEFTHKLGTSDLEEACFWGVPPKSSSSACQIEPVIIQVVQGNAGINQTSLVSAVKDQLKERGISKGAGVHKVEKAIDKLAQSGELALEIGDKGAKKYSLPEKNDDPEAESITDLQPQKITA
jgi:hypothetical protein